ncbi:cysteine synthase family protein [Candidatus Woesearchaeota archaeon]|nr:cysteine synthase family protein [Candidatus Woesearchaeota archaeon]
MFKNILQAIGNTPLVKINRLNPNDKVEIYAKIERVNPGGSVKDRIALSMIEAAERSGELVKGKTILEPTSGNTGIGLAMVAAVKGYRALFVMAKSVSVERKKILRAFGAEILLTDASKGTDGAIEKAYKMARDEPDKYFMPDQFNNEDNWKAHYYGTGEEIWKQTKGKVTMFVAGIGTSGTLTGVSKRLKEYDKRIRIIAAEPLLKHKLQGLKNMKESYKPSIYDKSLLDEKVPVKDEDGFLMTRRLAKEEGILAGMSSGAAMHAAVEMAKDMEGGLIVVLLADGGEKYLSTGLFG